MSYVSSATRVNVTHAGLFAPAPFTLNVLTYNMHKGFAAGNRRFVLPQLRDALEEADVDLIFLQETQGEHREHQTRVANWPSATQFEFLAHRLWPHYAYGKNAVYRAGHHGNAILSKYPFSKWENINVSAFRSASRSLLHGVITLPEDKGPVHLICIHFDVMASQRQRQLAILRHYVEKQIPHGAPLIVAGDFNDWWGEAEYEIGAKLGMGEVFKALRGRHARTFPAWLPVLPVDRIYYRAVTPLACEWLKERRWRRMSDHVALHATFAVSTQEYISELRL